jgi:hypothetical protein
MQQIFSGGKNLQSNAKQARYGPYASDAVKNVNLGRVGVETSYVRGEFEDILPLLARREIEDTSPQYGNIPMSLVN